MASKAQAYLDQSIEELEAVCNDIRKELFNLKNEWKQTRKTEKPHLLRTKRKDLARAMTVLHQKTLSANECAV